LVEENGDGQPVYTDEGPGAIFNAVVEAVRREGVYLFRTVPQQDWVNPSALADDDGFRVPPPEHIRGRRPTRWRQSRICDATA
jgi:hypothetical protein